MSPVTSVFAVVCLLAPAAEPEGETEPTPEAAPDPATDDAAPNPGELAEIKARLDEMERENAAFREEMKRENEALREENEDLREKIELLEEDSAYQEEKLQDLLPLSGRVGGYADVGFFFVDGDGSGIRADTAGAYFPEYLGIIPEEWVFMGDPLSTAINSRGDPAETAESRAVFQDGVNNRGKASFIVNNLNLQLFAGLGDNLTIDGMVDFLPRNRDVSDPDGVNLGDFVDVKMAYVRYNVPVKRFSLAIYAGKFDPVFGYEYRIQESPSRVTVTPSLLCRYTCGRPTGVKTRWKFLAKRNLIFNFSATNGSSNKEQFGFANDVDTNHFKTLAGRLSYEIPVAGLEIGASGSYGAQDLQTDDQVAQWQYGFDLHLDIRGVDLTGEFIMARAEGDPPITAPIDERCGNTVCLRAMGAYGLLGYRALNWLMPYVRADWRDAVHRSGASFVYISELVRITAGIRFDINEHALIKAEYIVNRELGKIPQFRNDVFTSSLVAHF